MHIQPAHSAAPTTGNVWGKRKLCSLPPRISGGRTSAEEERDAVQRSVVGLGRAAGASRWGSAGGGSVTISAGGGMDGDEGDGKYGGALTLRGGFADGYARIDKGGDSVLRRGDCE